MNRIIQTLAHVIYLKNYTAMPFQNMFSGLGGGVQGWGGGQPGRVAGGHPAVYFRHRGLACSPGAFMFLEHVPVVTSISSFRTDHILVGASMCTSISTEEETGLEVKIAARRWLWLQSLLPGSHG